MFKRYLLIIIAVLIILLVGFYYYFFIKPFPQSEKEEKEEKEAVLMIDFGERKRSFAGEAIEGMTVYDALLVSAKAGDFDFEFENSALKKIDEFEENGKKWNLYLNRKKVEDDLTETVIEAGDKVELRFE